MRLMLFVLCSLSTLMGVSQVVNPDFGLVFPQDEVPTVRITIDPDTLDAVFETGVTGDQREYKATFRFESSGLTQTIQQVGFRLRGNTSLQAQRKSFKVSFNTYVSGAKWQGLEKLNLNGSHNDPSRMRANLSWNIMRNANLPASRAGYVKFYINDEYKGLYNNIEHIDEQFTKRIDGIGSGNLYKCLYPAPLTFIGNNPDSYKLEAQGRRVYDLNNNQYLDDYSDLANFIKVLNQTPINNLPCELEAVFNVDSYLKQAALDVLIGNWDGYIYNHNNFYLYHNLKTDLMEFIAYDVDNTLGIDWLGIDWTTRNIYTWSPSWGERPLFTRLLEVPQYRARFTNYMHELINTSCNADSVAIMAQHDLDLISSAVQTDPYHSLDYGFSYNDFLQSIYESWGGQVDYGIVPYVEARNNTALNQLDNIVPTKSLGAFWMQHNYPEVSSGIAMVAAFGNIDSTVFQFSLDGNSWTDGGFMKDDGIFPDALSNDGIFTSSLPSFPSADFIYCRAAIVDSSVFSPCDGKVLFLTESNSQIFINEIMTDNATVIADENGQFDDWIELWNAGANSISLNGKFLSDDADEPYKFALPNVALTPGQHLLFWADNDELLNRYHTNFSLAASGETLRLYTKEMNSPRLVDVVEVPDLTEDFSYGRITDGSAVWVTFEIPTPQATNQVLGIENSILTAFNVFPNPANHNLYFTEFVKTVEVIDLTGRTIIKKGDTNQIDISSLNVGLYLIKTEKGTIKFFKSE